MPNITPADAHVMRPLTAYTPEGTTGVSRQGSKSFSGAMDNEWKVRRKKAKRKVKQIEYSPDWVEKKFHSAKNRRSLAAQGNALPDGSYPINDPEDLHSAAVLARSGHGDAAAAKRLIARRAKAMGVSNPLAEKSDVNKSNLVLMPMISCFSRLTE